MTSDAVRVEREGAVAILTMNRPERRNAINAALARGVCDAIAAAQDARAIVLTGADPAFSAGLDLRDLGVEKLVDLPPIMRAVGDSGVPIIAAVNGPAVTGGFEIALLCDFMVASERASFADTHVRVGVFPGPVLLELPKRVGMVRAREMSLTGNFVDAKTALAIGLVNHVVPHAELLPFAKKLAADIAEGDPELVGLIRRAWVSTTNVAGMDAKVRHVSYQRLGGNSAKKGSEIAARRDAVVRRARSQRE